MPSSLNATSRQCRIMQLRIIATQQMDDVIITTTNILHDINHQKLHHLLDPHRLQYVNYISDHHSQQYINYHCKNNLFHCCSLCLCNIAISFVRKVIVHKPVFILLSNKGQRYASTELGVTRHKRNMLHNIIFVVAYAYLWLPDVCDRNQQNSQFLGPFLL